MGDTAISANGPSTVTNAGQVIGLFLEGLALGSGGNVVSNSGLIFGRTSGITSTGAGNDITNHGWIHGGISLTSDNNVILNFGTIDGDQAGIKVSGAVGSTNTIINWGPTTWSINRGYLQLQFVGYGPGATFVQIDATHWQVNSGDALVHETIAFQNGAPVHMSDVLFA